MINAPARSRALHERRLAGRSGLLRHSDRGSQYVSIRYTERLAEAGIESSLANNFLSAVYLVASATCWL